MLPQAAGQRPGARGVTPGKRVVFTISGEDGERERTLPLDLVPRVIDASGWALVEAGLVQRVRALNAFLADVYAERRVLHDRVVPPRLVLGSPQYQRSGTFEADYPGRLSSSRRVGVTSVEYGLTRG
jgi:uncharacterized circularly permuted ATP-grasp superfamily protein